MALLNFKKRDAVENGPVNPTVEAFLQGYSIEVMPRTAEKVEDFRALLPEGTRVSTSPISRARRSRTWSKRPSASRPRAILSCRTSRRGSSRMRRRWKIGFPCTRVKRALSRRFLLAGGVAKPHGDFDSSMQLLETGLFDKAGFKRLHVAGHPEGNKDIDPDGSTKNVDDALRWKQKFSETTDAEMALATQFAFDAKPIIAWADSLKEAGIDLPIHIGIAGPAKLQTLIKFAIACGVGPSLKVLQKRAMDVSKLLLPYEPTDVVTELANHKAANPDFNITKVHFFPLGGIKTNANWAINNGGASAKPVNS